MAAPTTTLLRRARIAAPPSLRNFPYSLAAAAFIFLWTSCNLAYLGGGCPHDLAPDEAHYWHWSRHPDWSYYSKGPLVAWLIRGSGELFAEPPGELFAVRLPAVLSSAALLAGLFVLIADVLRDRRVALAAIICVATVPAITAGAVLMTIDPPFLACWCWALVGVNRALRRPAGVRWWWFAGAGAAVGVLAKYSMLLLPAAVAGYFLVQRRNEFRRPGIWIFLTLTVLGSVPIVLWNADHGWVSVRHVLGQALGNNRAKASWLNPLGYVGGQVGVLLGFWFAAWAGGVWRFRPRRTAGANDTGLSLMWWASAPVWGVFLLASVNAPAQVNWPAAAYVGGAVLAAAWLRDQLARSAHRRYGRGIIITCVLGLIGSAALRFPQLYRPVLAALLPEPSAANPTPIRRLDPTARLQGWRTLAAELDRLRGQLQRETGTDPALAGMVWKLPGEFAFYCRGHPEAYSFGPALEDRHSQYELWRPNPVSDPEAFRGRTFIYVGEPIPDAALVFDSVDPPIVVVHCEGGIPIAVWKVWVCRGFRGFPPRGEQESY